MPAYISAKPERLVGVLRHDQEQNLGKEPFIFVSRERAQALIDDKLAAWRKRRLIVLAVPAKNLPEAHRLESSAECDPGFRILDKRRHIMRRIVKETAVQNG